MAAAGGIGGPDARLVKIASDWQLLDEDRARRYGGATDPHDPKLANLRRQKQTNVRQLTLSNPDVSALNALTGVDASAGLKYIALEQSGLVDVAHRSS